MKATTMYLLLVIGYFIGAIPLSTIVIGYSINEINKQENKTPYIIALIFGMIELLLGLYLITL